MRIETERLILRPVCEEDCYDIFELSKDHSVGKNAGWKPHESIEETKKILNEIFIGKDGIFAIVLKDTSKVIGTVGLIDDTARKNSTSKMIGYSLSHKYWGLGYMTESVKAVIEYGFTFMDLSIISASCYPHNQRSKSVLKKCGVEYEGTLRQGDVIYDGTVYDCEYYSITEDEYKKITV